MTYDIFDCIKKNTGKPAIISNKKDLSYDELFSLIERIDLSLYGKHVIISCSDSIKFITVFLGCLYTGRAPIIVNKAESLTISKLVSKFNAVIVSDETVIAYNSFNNSNYNLLSPFFLNTSGTGGNSKLVKHRLRSIAASGFQFNRIFKIKQDDVIYSAAKMSHAFGLGNSISIPFTNGCSVVLDDRIPSSNVMEEVFTHNKITIFCGVPRHFKSVKNCNLSSVRMGLSAGDVMSDSLVSELKFKVVDAIGSTETLGFYASKCIGDRHYKTFKLIPGNKYRFDRVDSNINELKISSPITYNRWVRTSDIFDGQMNYKGRKGDRVKINGMYVTLNDIDKMISDTGNVVECISSLEYNRHEVSRLVIEVVPLKISSMNKVKAAAKSIEALNKIPHIFKESQTLNKTPTGKLIRNHVHVL